MRSSLLAPIFAFGILTSLACLAPACSANEAGDEGTDDELVGGEASGAADDDVVLLVRNGKPLCTATLVAPGLLVTAQHCVGQQQAGKMVNTFDPAEITVRLGAAPGDKAAAVATKIYTPRVAPTPTPPAPTPTPTPTTPPTTPTPTPTTPPTPTAVSEDAARALASMDLAAILVQSLDPAFDKLRPRRMRDKVIAEADTVSVVGWNATGADIKLAGLKRLKRANVDVLVDSTQQTSISAPTDATITTVNKVREFVSEAVACQGDDGAPAFDSEGNLAGVVAAVVGPCAVGSLSVFTDIGSQRSFLQGVIAEIAKLGCSSDAKCASAGGLCDTATFTCGQGCRVGSLACATGFTCAVPSETAGVVGTCKAGSATSATSDAGVQDSGSSPPPPPPLPPPTGVGEDAGAAASICKDSTCGGTTTAPKICNAKTQQCADGCRVGATPSMCGAAYECKAGTADPGIGTCVASNVTAPAPPTLTPPARPTENATGQTGSALSPSDDNGDGGAKKKTKNAVKESGGCSATPGMTSGAAHAGLVWLGLGAVIAFARRRRSAG